MSTESKRIVGSSKARKDRDTGTYSIEYYVVTAELEDYMPEVDDIAAWAPEPARVTFVEKTELSDDRWIVSIEAEPDATAVPGSITEVKDIRDQFEWKYKTVSLYYPPKIWGVRKAKAADISKSTAFVTVKNIDGKIAKVGDWIFWNFDSDPQLKGSETYNWSMFDPDSHPTIKLLNMKHPTDIFEVTFYSDKTPKQLKKFKGVNGKFPLAYEVYHGDVPQKWRLLFQRLESKQYNGENYVKVYRRFIYAWGGLWRTNVFGDPWSKWEEG